MSTEIVERESLYNQEISKLRLETDRLMRLAQSTIKLQYIQKPTEYLVLTDQYEEHIPGVYGRDIEQESGDRTTSVWKAIRGATVEPHTHYEVEFIYIITGRVNVFIPNQTITLSEYEKRTIHIEGDTPHKLEFLEDTRMIIEWKPKAMRRG